MANKLKITGRAQTDGPLKKGNEGLSWMNK
jgi:hypothetical protein